MEEIKIHKMDELFFYDVNSPSHLKWNMCRYIGKSKNILKCKIGDIAGTLNRNGYYKVNVLNPSRKCYCVHRIVWELHYGEISDEMVIDHIDRNPSNNNISNLRLVTQAVNKRNVRKYANNTTGFTGVRVYDDKGKRGYEATWIWEGKRKRKCFSFHVYGEELAFLLAIKYRREIIEKLNDLGAEYSEKHGE